VCLLFFECYLLSRRRARAVAAVIALIIDRRALVAALGALGECKATRPACEEEEGEEAEGEKDGAEDEAVDPPEVGVNVVVGDHFCTHGRSQALAGGGAEFDDHVEVHRKLEGAEVLRPADPDGDLIDLDEEARKEDLRDEDGRRRLDCLLSARCNTPCQQRHRRRRQRKQPHCEDVEHKVAVKGLEPVAGEEGDERRRERERQLHDELAPEIRHGRVGAVCVLAHEERALRGEEEYDWLSRTKHGRDGREHERPEVRVHIVVLGLRVSHLHSDDARTSPHITHMMHAHPLTTSGAQPGRR
jgi:hypothetical protein